MLSDSPPERKLEWTNSGIDGSNKYLIKVWKFFNNLPLNEISYTENYNYVDKKTIHLREKLIIILIKLLKVLIDFNIMFL